MPSEIGRVCKESVLSYQKETALAILSLISHQVSDTDSTSVLQNSKRILRGAWRLSVHNVTKSQTQLK